MLSSLKGSLKKPHISTMRSCYGVCVMSMISFGKSIELWGATTHPCLKFMGNLAKLPCKLVLCIGVIHDRNYARGLHFLLCCVLFGFDVNPFWPYPCRLFAWFLQCQWSSNSWSAIKITITKQSTTNHTNILWIKVQEKGIYAPVGCVLIVSGNRSFCMKPLPELMLTYCQFDL